MTRTAMPKAPRFSTRANASLATPRPPARDEARASDGAFRSPCPINATRNCVECHMPKVWYPEVHTRFTDHYIRVQIRSKDGG